MFGAGGRPTDKNRQLKRWMKFALMQLDRSNQASSPLCLHSNAERSQRTLPEPSSAKKHTSSAHRTLPLGIVRVYPSEEAMLHTISDPTFCNEQG